MRSVAPRLFDIVKNDQGVTGALRNAARLCVLTAAPWQPNIALLMPLVRIDVTASHPVQDMREIGKVIYDAMRATMDVPENDRFQVITRHASTEVVIDPGYLGIARSPDCVFIQVTLSEGRSFDQKRAFYKTIADGLHRRLSVRREDVSIWSR